MRRGLLTLAMLAALLLGPVGGRVAAQPPAGALKAAFLFNVLNFVEWPQASLPPGTGPLRIAIIAPRTPDDFVAALKGRVVRGHPLSVQTYDRVDVVEGAQAIFITSEALAQAKTVTKKVGGTPVLTMADQDLDAPFDTTMALGVVQAKLAFAVNLDEADAAGLQISPNLLKLARSVKSARVKTR
ncbi:MAG: YfiR family protein [Vicinamibacterales bacterium]